MHKKPSPRKIWPVPSLEEVLARQPIPCLDKPGDLAVRNGDIALTRWGDLMLNDSDYSACYRFVQTWRFNYPTQRFLFEAVFDGIEERALEWQVDTLARHNIAEIITANAPLQFGPKDPAEFWRLQDEIGGVEVAKGLYAGTVVLFVNRALATFRDHIGATEDEWAKAQPQISKFSFGQAMAATANNVRHGDEWQVTRPPTRQQLKSMEVLAAVLGEPMVGDGKNHRFGRDVAPEVLTVVSDGDFGRLETAVFKFLNDLLRLRTLRAPAT